MSLFKYDKDFGDMKFTLHHGVYVNALLQNEGFQDLIARRLAELVEGPLSTEAIQGTVDMLAGTIRSEMPLEKERWGGSVKQWEKMVQKINGYLENRPTYMINNFCSVLRFTAEQKEQYFGHLLKDE